MKRMFFKLLFTLKYTTQNVIFFFQSNIFGLTATNFFSFHYLCVFFFLHRPRWNP